MSLAGFLIVLLGVASYVVLLFVIKGWTYRTWIFDGLVVTGLAFALFDWWRGGLGGLAIAAVGIGTFWFGFSRFEFRLRGSEHLALQPGDPFPALSAMTVNRVPVTDRDLTSDGPALLAVYRGWWCPTSKVQLDTILAQKSVLVDAGVAVFAGSVDGPEEAAAIQEHVGASITILCGISAEFLERIGLHDRRGAPWFDRLLFGARRQPIAMPAVILLDAQGQVVSAQRSSRIDDGSPFTGIADLL